jgi:hypothetical protein
MTDEPWQDRQALLDKGSAFPAASCRLALACVLATKPEKDINV